MVNNYPFAMLTEKCDIFFEDLLISKELIIKSYADFLSSLLLDDKPSVSLALHTGSVCFEVMSILFAAIVSIAITLDQGDAEEIVDSLNIGEMVLYGRKRRERYVWCGFADKYYAPTSLKSKRYYGVLKQPTKNTKDKEYIPKQYWHLITPYDGKSQLTDGRGIKVNSSNRNNFISYLFGVNEMNIPSVSNISTVIVATRGLFERISKGLRIVYGEEKSIGLLDMVTASYFSDSGEDYQFGSNPSKTEPLLKVTSKISTARDLVLDKQGNKTIGLVVIGDNAVSKGCFELYELLHNNVFKFTHIAAGIDSGFAESFLDSQTNISVFACTKEFLLRNSLPPLEKNTLTIELGKQIDNIIDNFISTIVVDIDCTWEDYRYAKEALYSIKQSNWNENEKNCFLIAAYSLLNLFLNAVFPIEKLEKAIAGGEILAGIVSPAVRIRELENLAKNAAEPVKKWCEYIVTFFEYLYQSLMTDCPKRDSLLQYIRSNARRGKVVVVVPKTFYVDIIRDDDALKIDNVNVVSASRFDNENIYDEVIVVGDIWSKRFNPLKCKASANITVLLYKCETRLFEHKICKAKIFENKLNDRIGVLDDFCDDTDLQFDWQVNKDEGFIDNFVRKNEDLERYIDRISTFAVREYMLKKVSGITGGTQTAEVTAIGKFLNGEQILFSKLYRAVVFDPAKGIVYEVDVEDLEVGDQLIIFKRDGYTRNTVDWIIENLQKSGRLGHDVVEAIKKAKYWKKVLKDYKIIHGLSYRDIAKMLQKLGSEIQEVTVRQWLIEESHVVGPRDEDTLLRIAELTRDSRLLANTHDYFEACRIVRRYRKKILDLIGKVIVDKLCGNRPAIDSVLEIVYDNVENLSEILELDTISLLDEPMMVPVNLINKPIAYLEAIF